MLFLSVLIAAHTLSTDPGLTEQKYSWKNVSIVAGGFISGIVYHPHSPNLAYLRTDIGGAYRWEESEHRWVSLLDWLTKPDWNLYGIESIALDPLDPKRLYLACGTYTQSWAGNGAILSSTDQGKTFSRSDLPFKLGGNEDGRSMGERLAVDPNDGKDLLFGSRNSGLWGSHDYGLHWAKVDSFPALGDKNFGITSIVFDKRSSRKKTPTQAIYVGVASHTQSLFRSLDGGVHWQAVSNAPTGQYVHHLCLSENGKLFVTYTNGSGPNGVTAGGVFRYDLDENRWKDITPVPGCGYAGLSIDPMTGSTVSVSTLDRWSPGDDVFFSTDSGDTWKGLSQFSKRDSSAAPYMTWGQPEARFGWWIGALAIDPFNLTKVLYGTGANVWGCDDVLPANIGKTITWTVRGVGIEETADIDLLSPANGPHLISALGDIGGFTHQNLDQPAAGMSLNPMLSNTDSVASAPDASLIVKVGRPNAGNAPGGYSKDFGVTWRPFNGLPTSRSNGGSTTVTADGKFILWSPNGLEPYWSDDLGRSWNACTGVNQSLQLAADTVKANLVYGITRDGKLFSSTDYGKSFTQGPTLTSSGVMRSMPEQSGTVFVPSDSGLFFSTDSAFTFKKMADVESAESVGFGKSKVGSSTPTIFINGKVEGVFGVFRSDDFGSHWTKITDAAHEYGTRGIVIGDPRIYGRVYMGTNGRGVLYADPER